MEQKIKCPYCGYRMPILKGNKAKAQDMVRAMHDEMMIIPIYNVYDSFVLKDNVMDSGYGHWASTSIWRPGEAWLAQ